ncbi:MAG: hypothetical protein MUP13_07385 [Thermoanaerobaculales bacterium]|nr:hypothetical protein [Thermoanaerobaculales bacterium]
MLAGKLTITATAVLILMACTAQAEQQFGNKSVYVHVPATLDDGRSVVLYVSDDWKVLVAFDITDCSIALTIP